MAKRLTALLLAVLLMTGCADLELVPQRPPVPVPSAPPAKERSLSVYDPDGVITEVLAIYAKEQTVTVTAAKNVETAQLAVFDKEPEFGKVWDLAQRPGLVGLLAAQSPCAGFELGTSSYGYVADTALLKALLGDAGSPEKMRALTAGDWQNLLTALSGWIKEPENKSVYLARTNYSLPDTKEGPAQNLSAVFSAEESTRFSGPLFAPVIGTCFKNEEGFVNAADRSALRGSVNSLYTLLSQEAESFAEDGLEAFARGETVFCRTSLQKAQAVCGSDKNLTVLPLKFTFDYTDIHGGLSLKELLEQPVSVSGGWLAIPLNAPQPFEADAFLLWAFASKEGQRLPKSDGPAAEGMPNLALAVDRHKMEKLAELGRAQQDWTRDGRRQYTEKSLAILQEKGE